MPDTRYLGIVADPRAPHSLSANTWAFIEQNVKLLLSGMGGC